MMLWGRCIWLYLIGSVWVLNSLAWVLPSGCENGGQLRFWVTWRGQKNGRRQMGD